MSFSGGGSKSKETTRAAQEQVETPTYQTYADEIIRGMYPSLQQMYGLAARGYEQAAAGMTPEERALWEQTRGYADQYGVEGPAAMYAQQYLAPTMGAGWMGQLDPYYAAQRQLIEQAMPAETAAFVQQAKREAGPAWGTHGRAAEAFGTGLAQLRMQQAQNLAGIYGQQAGAAQTGMQYTGQMVPQYAAMRDPYAWGQQRLGWAGMPEQAAIAKQQARQQLVLPWSQQLAGMAEMGYQYPQEIGTTGTSVSRTTGKSYGMGGQVSYCWIVRKLYGEGSKYGKILIDVVNNRWPRTFFGTILNALYGKYGERIANYISRAGVRPTLAMLITKSFFDIVYLFSKKEIIEV